MIDLDPYRHQLKDLLWNFRKQYRMSGVVAVIDRLLPYLSFNQPLSEETLKSRFTEFKQTLPEDWTAVLISMLQDAILAYWNLANTKTGLRKYRVQIKVLTDILRNREQYKLIPDNKHGWRIGKK